MLGCIAFMTLAAGEVGVIDRPVTEAPNDYYAGNREPLLASPLIKLPVGAIRPEGWIRRQLELQAEGFIGHLTEISGFLKKENNAWLSAEGVGDNGWEEVPYWLKGFGDTGYILGDERIVKEAKVWIEALLSSQREDGYFGPRANLTHLKGKPDLWPNMIALFALQSYYEYTGDDRVIDFMRRYFKWELEVPEEDFLLPFWQQQRAADNLYSVYWLYNRTGDAWLLDLAAKIHRRTADWTDDVANWHNVNMSQAFGGPATYYPQSKDRKHLDAAERNYQKIRRMYGQVPGGMFGGDENCRPGYIGPRQAIETCGMVEMMLSCETLLAIAGNPVWADRCEDVTFNSLPAALTADHKGLRYLTAPNQPLSDKEDKSPGVQNGGPMFLMDPHGHRCCQHNMGHGWAYYAESLWMATPGNGLAAVLYGACQVTAQVGAGTEVTLKETTHYPFDERIEFEIGTSAAVSFPLYLRVPEWCRAPKVSVNGAVTKVTTKGHVYIVINREWRNGDRVELELPMPIILTTWTENEDCVSVSRGPLTYSLKIGEEYVRVGGTDAWPALEIHPTTPWNYGLDFDDAKLSSAFEVVHKDWPADDQPFEANAAPIELRTKARRIPNWQLDSHGLVREVEQSPVKSDEPVETVTLIPMGAARLRISAFPRIGHEPDAHEWPAPPPPPPFKASYVNDSLEALMDGSNPTDSNDHSIPRFTWWNHMGSEEWVQRDFDEAKEYTETAVYWFDDTAVGQCRVPQSWQLLYLDGEDWKPVDAKGAYGVKRDCFNTVKFKPVTTTALRIEVQLQPKFSGGILEWKVK